MGTRSRRRLFALVGAVAIGSVGAACAAETETVRSEGTVGAAPGTTEPAGPATADYPVITGMYGPSSAQSGESAETIAPSPPPPVSGVGRVPITTTTVNDPNPPTPPVTAPPTVLAADGAAVLDCGIIYRASGWPTTYMASDTYFTCIEDSFTSGTPARLVDRAQTDGLGGAILVTTYDVLGPGSVRVTVDATAAADRPQGITVSMCTGLSTDSYEIVVTGCAEVPG